MFGNWNWHHFSGKVINLPNSVTPNNKGDYGITTSGKKFKAYYDLKQKQIANGTYTPVPTNAPFIFTFSTASNDEQSSTSTDVATASSAQASATTSTSLTSSTTTGNEVALVEASSNTSNRFFSDVDINIPSSAQDNENTFVVIFANENYQSEVKVDYAINDGEMFQAYCYNVLGVPSENIHIAEDATLNNMIAEFDWIQKISKAYNGDAKFLVYYAGHGIPDEATGQSYLLPVDGKGSILRTAFSLKEFYQTLGSLEAKNVTVFMDACFSGSKRGDGMLAAARGVAIKAKNEAPKGNLVVFSAAQGDETAYPYNDKQHGLFTYYLLKKLQDTKGNVTLGELSDYISTQVSRKSIVSNGKSQTPSTLTSTTLADSWKTIKLK